MLNGAVSGARDSERPVMVARGRVFRVKGTFQDVERLWKGGGGIPSRANLLAA